jgi:hypothetical protein
MLSRMVTILMAVAMSTQIVNAQSTFGSMVGIVKDPGALVIAGAQLTLIGLDDGSTHAVTTNDDGTFEFMNLKAGRYALAVQAAGFADFKMPLVQLSARQTLRMEIALKVKSTSETIEVGDTAPMINTESATLSDTKDFVQVSQLPVNYRGAPRVHWLWYPPFPAHNRMRMAMFLSEADCLHKFSIPSTASPPSTSARTVHLPI